MKFYDFFKRHKAKQTGQFLTEEEHATDAREMCTSVA